MPRWLVRFGYDGAGFYGWARQPGLRTVEGTLRAGLVRRSIVDRPEAARLDVASRTDRGVSARGNALTLSASLSPPALLNALNGIAPDLFFTDLAPVSADFRPRQAASRWYRYFEPAAGHDRAFWSRVARSFHGRIDVRSLGRGLPRGEPIWRTVDSVEVTALDPDWLVVDLRAPSFVWGMVRKIVGALRAVEAGTLAVDRLDAALQGRQRLPLPIAEAEGLVLWEVHYPISWAISWGGPNRHQERYVSGVVGAARRREVIARSFSSRELPRARRPD